jgi:hypothetical protein
MPGENPVPITPRMPDTPIINALEELKEFPLDFLIKPFEIWGVQV